MGAALKSLVGGEIRYFTNLMYASRTEAMERLVRECMMRGGNAIIALRFDQGEVSALILNQRHGFTYWITGHQKFLPSLRVWYGRDCGRDRFE